MAVTGDLPIVQRESLHLSMVPSLAHLQRLRQSPHSLGIPLAEEIIPLHQAHARGRWPPLLLRGT